LMMVPAMADAFNAKRIVFVESALAV